MILKDLHVLWHIMILSIDCSKQKQLPIPAETETRQGESDSIAGKTRKAFEMKVGFSITSSTFCVYPYDASAAPIIQSLGWSTISDLVRKETATLTYKSLNSLAPNYLRKLFAKCSDERQRFLCSSEIDLKIPFRKTTSGQRTFFIAVQNCGTAWKELLNCPPP